MATSNVIFAIGSKMGPGGLASLQAGVQMVGQLGAAMLETIRAVDEYTRSYKNLQVDISLAQKATKNLVDDTLLMQKANQLSAAGVKLSSKQFADATKVAVKYARVTGVDTKQALDQLMEGLAQGEAGSLKRFGVQMEATGDKTKDTQEILRQLGDVADNTAVELKTLGDKLTSISNSASTAFSNFGMLVNEMDTGPGLIDLLVTAFNALNKEMADSVETSKELGQEFLAVDTIFAGMAEEIGIGLSGLNLSIAEMTGSNVDYFQNIYDEAVNRQQESLEQMAKNEQAFLDRTGKSSILEGTGLGGTDSKKKKKRRGGKKDKFKEEFESSDFFMEFTEEEAGIVSDEDLLSGKSKAFDEATARTIEAQRLEKELKLELMEIDSSRLDQDRAKLELRQEEISMQMQMRDMQKELQELGAAGIETGHLQSDFGMIATEEGNELKQEKMDLLATEMDLMRQMNTEKIEQFEKEKELSKELINLQDMKKNGIESTAKVGSNAFAAFAKQKKKEREAEAKGIEVQKVGFKSFIAEAASAESMMQGVMAIKETALGLASCCYLPLCISSHSRCCICIVWRIGCSSRWWRWRWLQILCKCCRC
jgi:hypothetical protein